MSCSVDLEQHATAAALAEAVSPDALKAELTRLGLKCGGNLAQRADRLFATKGKVSDHSPCSRHGLSSNPMARIISNRFALRHCRHGMALITSDCGQIRP